MDFTARMPSFGEMHFGSARLGDARRTRRLVKVANRIIQHPGGTLPQKFRKWKDLTAVYRLVRADAVTHAAVLEPHRLLVADRMARLGPEQVVLLIHDTTELDYTTHCGLEGLGQIGNGGGRGYLCHNTLAVTEDRQVIGLANQVLQVRRRVPAGETPAEKRDCPERESRLWLKGVEGVGPAPAGHLWVDVADRGADTFEFLEYELGSGRSFVIRCARNRNLDGEDHVAADRIHLKLHEYTRDLPTLGERTVSVAAASAARGRKATQARQARVRVAAGPVSLRVPHFARGQSTAESLEVWVIHVREIDGPPESPPLEWLLLSNQPAATFEQAARIVDWYELRPAVEDYHKGLKTGCGIENPQFQEQSRLEPMIALLSVVAATLLQLRDLARGPDADLTPATTVMPESFVKMLGAWHYKEHRPHLSVREFAMALGSLGGHLNRKRDGFPGWLTLWRGWAALQLMVEGAEAVQRIKCV